MCIKGRLNTAFFFSYPSSRKYIRPLAYCSVIWISKYIRPLAYCSVIWITSLLNIATN